MSSLKIKSLLSALLILLLIGTSSLFFFIYQSSEENKKKVENLESLNSTIQSIVNANSLVHELQKERGRTSGYLSAKGTKFSAELKAQRELADKAFNNLKTFFKSDKFQISDSSKREEFLKIIDNFKEHTSNARILTDKIESNKGKVLGLYTKQIRYIFNLLESSKYLAASNVELFNELNSYKAILEEKERNGITRAVLSGILASDTLTTKSLQKATELQGQIKYFQTQFELFANQKAKKTRNDLITGFSVKKVKQIVDLIILDGRKSGFGFSASEWFDYSTKKINLIKKLEDSIAEDIRKNSYSLIDQYQAASNTNIYIAVVIFSLVIIGFLITSSVISKNITTTAKSIRLVVSETKDGKLDKKSSHC